MSDHVHRWRLADQLATNVPATCACGAERVFAGNDLDWKYGQMNLSPRNVEADVFRGIHWVGFSNGIGR